jgi:hypothetical protein
MKLLSLAIILLAILLVVLYSCTKNTRDADTIITNNSQQRDSLQSCDFGITQFNMIARPQVPSTPVTESKPGPSNATSVVFIDFDGHFVSQTNWNFNGDFNCNSAGLNTAEITEILERVSEDYRPFNIQVTLSEAVYNSVAANKRMRVVVTESHEWYGMAGGVSFIGSFMWGDNTPCFVFSLLLGYNVKKIAEAVSHEVGHTFGLYHQVVFDTGCNRIAEYNLGIGSGETGWAPIMGMSYDRNLTLWHNGPNIYNCTGTQDETGIISGIVGLKNDDYPNMMQNNNKLNGAAEGVISYSSDVDFFVMDINQASLVSVNPFNVGINNNGANLDLVIRIYNRNKQLLATINDPTSLSASTTVTTPGRYYLSVSTAANAFASSYGMLGKYQISMASL